MTGRTPVDIYKLGGLFKKMPFAAVGFIIAGLVSMGMPGFSGFIAEFPIFMGVWQAMPIVAMIAVLGSDHHRGVHPAGGRAGVLRGNSRPSWKPPSATSA